jgi:menaquinone-dependent protoporphyrinogen oxidase
MNVLVAYVTKYGATLGIAERVAERLRVVGLTADVRPAATVHELTGYHAFVIGSAAYMGHWHREAAEFVRNHLAVLTNEPVWLFSSGPLGVKATDAQGRDLRVTSEPKEFAEFRASVHPRGERVFFGALDLHKLGFRDGLVAKLPAGKELLPEGDFRDWAAIDAWADEIGQELTAVPAAGR